jgi:hypothetical protein
MWQVCFAVFVIPPVSRSSWQLSLPGEKPSRHTTRQDSVDDEPHLYE